jgi:hypothetical protein
MNLDELNHIEQVVTLTLPFTEHITMKWNKTDVFKKIYLLYFIRYFGAKMSEKESIW